MFEDSGYDGLPRENPGKMLFIIICMALVLYVPFGILAFFSQDENLKQQMAQGYAHLNAQDYAQAAAVLKQAHARYPKSTDVMIGLGIAYTQMGAYKEAEALFEEALAGAPDDLRIMFNQALMYLHREDFEAAIRRFHEVLDKDALYPEVHYHLGYIAERQGRLEQARTFYINELNANASCAKAWYNLERLKANISCSE